MTKWKDGSHTEKCDRCYASVSVCDKTQKPIDASPQTVDICPICYRDWVRLTPEQKFKVCKRKGHDWMKNKDDNTFSEIEEEWECSACDATASIAADVRTSDLRFIDWED